MTKKFFVQVFFGFVILFFAIFLMSPKGPPFIFSYFAKELMFKNSQRPPFTFFGIMRLTIDQKKFRKKISKNKFEKNIKKFGILFQFFPHAGTVEEITRLIEVLLLFLSLRYGADLGRSRLVVLQTTILTLIGPLFRNYPETT